MTAAEFKRSGLGRSGLQLVVVHTHELDEALPEALRRATLLYVVPARNSIRSFARKLHSQCARCGANDPLPVVRAAEGNVELPHEMTVAEAFVAYGRGANRLAVVVSWGKAGGRQRGQQWRDV